MKAVVRTWLKVRCIALVCCAVSKSSTPFNVQMSSHIMWSQEHRLHDRLNTTAMPIERYVHQALGTCTLSSSRTLGCDEGDLAEVGMPRAELRPVFHSRFLGMLSAMPL